jgi:hypothetical protein
VKKIVYCFHSWGQSPVCRISLYRANSTFLISYGKHLITL